MKIYIMDSYWNHHSDVIPVRIHNVCFHGEINPCPAEPEHTLSLQTV